MGYTSWGVVTSLGLLSDLLGAASAIKAYMLFLL